MGTALPVAYLSRIDQPPPPPPSGRLYPDPPSELTLCFYNETNQVSGLEVAFQLTQQKGEVVCGE